MKQKQITKRLNELDERYPNIFKMPKGLRKEYTTLTAQLVSNVWSARAKKHGSIHSHLALDEPIGK